MDFIIGLFTFIGMFITGALALAIFSVWLDNKMENSDKKETVIGPLPKVDPNSFAAKWSIWMTNEVPRENIVGTQEWEAKYQPKS